MSFVVGKSSWVRPAALMAVCRGPAPPSAYKTHRGHQVIPPETVGFRAVKRNISIAFSDKKA